MLLVYFLCSVYLYGMTRNYTYDESRHVLTKYWPKSINFGTLLAATLLDLSSENYTYERLRVGLVQLVVPFCGLLLSAVATYDALEMQRFEDGSKLI